MYRLIKKAAQAVEENSPKKCVLGLKICTVALIVMFVGFSIGFYENKNIGKTIAFLGFIPFFYGMAICYAGWAKQLINNRKEEKAIREKYENPKQPWE